MPLDLHSTKSTEKTKSSLYTYEVGDKGPAGGWIFYDCDLDNASGNADGLESSICGWRYLEAAPIDLMKSTWGDDGFYGTKTDIGTGESNTLTISIEASEVRKNNAAIVCDSFTYGGYSDWFLPSKDELNLMYVNLLKAGLGGFEAKNYWSSSADVFSDNHAWAQNFGTGKQNSFLYGSTMFVRLIRAF